MFYRVSLDHHVIVAFLMLAGISIPVSHLKEHSDFSSRKSLWPDRLEHLLGEEALELINETKQNKAE